MKSRNLSKLLEVIIFTLITFAYAFTAFSNENDSLRSNNLIVSIDQHEGSDNYTLSIENKLFNPVYIKIIDAKKKMVFFETLKDIEKLSKVYTLSNLPKGSYNLLISNGESTLSKDIKIISNIEDHPDSGKSLVVNFSDMTHEKEIELSVQNTTDHNAVVKVYSHSGQILLTDSLGVNNNSMRNLKLNKLDKGAYLIKVESKKNVYRKKVHL